MGRPKRRQADIKQLNARAISLAAIHEAGHVAGRFLTAELMGHDPAIAVDFVEMHRRDDASKTPGMGDPCQIPESTTCGPMFSRAIEALSAVVAARHGILADGA